MPERAVERDWVSPKVLGKGEMGSALVDLGKGNAFLQSSPSNVSRLFQSPSILLFQFRPREFVLVAGQVHKPRARDGCEFRCGGVVLSLIHI